MVMPAVAVPRVKNLLLLMLFELEMKFVLAVPPNDVYWPFRVVDEAATALAPPTPVAFPSVTEELVKLPVVTNCQYSVVLIPVRVASTVPPAFALNACTCAVTTPDPVVGLTSAKGKKITLPT